jgi:hypothetical protein
MATKTKLRAVPEPRRSAALLTRRAAQRSTPASAEPLVEIEKAVRPAYDLTRKWCVRAPCWQSRFFVFQIGSTMVRT